MGTKMAPTYATLVMGFLEQQIYQKYEEKYGRIEREKFMKEFKRFLDDCCMFWQKSETELKDFFKVLNSLHEKIKFTMEAHPNKLSFLDILICKENTHVYTDIYYKETDSHQFLDFFFMSPETHKTKHSIHSSETYMCSCEKGKYQGKTIGRTRSIFTKAKLPEGNH